MLYKGLEISNSKQRITKLQKEIMKNEMLNPSNINIKIQIKSPVIDVKQNKDAHNYIRIFLGTSHVSNKRSICPARHISMQIKSL